MSESFDVIQGVANDDLFNPIHQGYNRTTSDETGIQETCNVQYNVHYKVQTGMFYTSLGTY